MRIKSRCAAAALSLCLCCAATIKAHREPLVTTTAAVTTSPSQDNLARQTEELRAMLTALTSITNVIKLPPPKSRGGLDHEYLINENLDHLRDAVSVRTHRMFCLYVCSCGQ